MRENREPEKRGANVDFRKRRIMLEEAEIVRIEALDEYLGTASLKNANYRGYPALLVSFDGDFQPPDERSTATRVLGNFRPFRG